MAVAQPGGSGCPRRRPISSTWCACCAPIPRPPRWSGCAVAACVAAADLTEPTGGSAWPQQAPDRIDLGRVLRADPSAAAMVWLRGRRVVRRVRRRRRSCWPTGGFAWPQQVPDRIDLEARAARRSLGRGDGLAVPPPRGSPRASPPPILPNSRGRLSGRATGGPPGSAGPGAARRADLAWAALPAARHRPATHTPAGPRAELATGGGRWVPGRLPVAIPSFRESSAALSSAHDPGAPIRAQALSHPSRRRCCAAAPARARR